MVFKNPPTALDGVIFAVIRRIVSEHYFKIIFVSKLGQALHKLGPMTGIVRPIVQLDDQLIAMAILVFITFPPMFKAINNKIAGFKRDTKVYREQPPHHRQNTQGDQF